MSTPSIEDVLARALSQHRDARDHAPDCTPDYLCRYCEDDAKPLADAIRAHLAEHTDEAARRGAIKALREAADENDVARHIYVGGRDVSGWLRDKAAALAGGASGAEEEANQ